jgi:outer membrane protein assembly factor BamB
MDDLYQVANSCQAVVQAKDGTLYTTSISPGRIPRLYAYNPRGLQKWSFEPQGFPLAPPAIAADGSLILACQKYIYCLEPDSSVRWMKKTANLFSSGPAIAPNGDIYICDGVYLLALGRDGMMTWCCEYEHGFASTPAVGADGTVYFTTDQCKLIAVGPDHAVKWMHAAPDGYTQSNSALAAPAITPDGTIICTLGRRQGTQASEAGLFAVTPGGATKWAVDYKCGAESSPAVAADGTTYICTDDDRLIAVDSNGSKKWETSALEGAHRCTPTIDCDGSVYVVASTGTRGGLFAFSSQGKQLWNETFWGDKPEAYTRAAIGADHQVYAMIGGNIMAISEPPATVVTQMNTKTYTAFGQVKQFDSLTSFTGAPGVSVIAIRLFQELGATFDYAWSPTGGVITLSYGNKVVTLREGSDQMTVVSNGVSQTVKLRTPVITRYGRSFIPTRDVSDYLGFEVVWNAADNSITLGKKEAKQSPLSTVGRQAVDGLAGVGLDGTPRTITTSGGDGRVKLLVFLDPASEPSVKAWEYLQPKLETLRTQGVDTFFILRPTDANRQWGSPHAGEATIILDEGYTLETRFGLEFTPVSFVIDRAGRLAASVPSPAYYQEELQATLEQLLKE